MNIAKTLVAMTVCLAVPAEATDWRGATDIRGGFAGVRARLPLGGGAANRVRTSLTIAPTQMRIAGDGFTATRIGEGLSLHFGATKPELTLGGIPADMALGFRQQGSVDSARKLGLSKGAWIGIGVGVVAVAAVIFVTNFTCVGEDPDYCGSD